MLVAAVFLGTLAIFTASLLLAARGAGSRDPRMEARFALMQAESMGHADAEGAALLKDVASSSGALARVLERLQVSQRLARLAVQAARPVVPARFLLQCVGCGLGGALLGFAVLRNVWLVLLLGAAAGWGPLLLLQVRAKRRLGAFGKALPDTIEMMARALRAGHSLVAALGIVAEQAAEPLRGEFAEVFRQQNFGLPLRDALMQLLERVPSQDLRVLVTGILVQKDTGGNLTQILDRTAAVIRERMKLKGDIRVHTAQGRMTGWILCLLPVVMLVMINVVNPGYSKLLTEDALGRKLLYVGVGLLTTGALLIRKIVNGIEI